MPPSNGIGRGSGLGPLPFGRTGAGAGGIGRAGSFARRPFIQSPTSFTGSFTITGVTQNAAGNTLGGCTVNLFRVSGNAYLQTTVSDGSGNYSFTLWENAGPYYTTAYLAGSPDVEGITAKTLLAT